MSKKIEIDLAEARRVFDLLERLVSLFHQPMKYQDKEFISQFVNENFPEIAELYYDKVWDWLPEDVKKSIDEE